jgi:hypothetical protein
MVKLFSEFDQTFSPEVSCLPFEAIQAFTSRLVPEQCLSYVCKQYLLDSCCLNTKDKVTVQVGTTGPAVY